MECALSGKYYRINKKDGALERQDRNPWLTTTQKHFKWNLPQNTLVMFDEAHRARNTDSQAFALLDALIRLAENKAPADVPFWVLLASATMLENVNKHMPVVMYLTRIINRPERALALKVLREPHVRMPVCVQMRIERKRYMSPEVDLLVLHHLLFEGSYPCAHGMQLSVTMKTRRGVNDIQLYNVHNAFMHQVRVVSYLMTTENRQAIAQASDTLWELLLSQDNDKLQSWHIILMSRLRVLTEHHKVDTFHRLTLCALESGLSVIVMVNFDATLTALSDALKKVNVPHSVIRGGQGTEERKKAIALFSQTSYTCAY